MEQVSLQQPASSPGRVLVVDDDAAVGLAIRLALKPFQVTFAQSASGALARVQAGADFQAVVCDLHMPGMSGMQFQEQLRAIAYGLADRIVFVTGGAQTAEAAAFLQRTTSLWLEKPFQREALQAAVTAAAARQPAR
jgi:two-component system, NtrC family, sensor kinase